MKVYPSILSANFNELEKEITAINTAGADGIHIDMMDGHFVPNLSFGPLVIAKLHEISSLPLDCHLMVSNPELYYKSLAEYKARFISFHYEVCKDNITKHITEIKKLNCLVGIAINPNTPVDVLTEYINDIDLVVLMSVNPGFGGQKFIPTTIDKIISLKNIITQKNSTALIEIDGGINKEWGEEVAKVGADIVVAGSYVFKNNCYQTQIRSLK